MLKEILIEKKVSQSELSRRTGINLRQVQKMVSGEYKMANITGKNLLAIADVLDVDPHKLLQ